MGERGIAADDVRDVVAAAIAALHAGHDRDWSVPAGDLEWNCWETVEHTADDLFAYAAQLAAGVTGHYLPFVTRARRPAGAADTVQVEPEAGQDGLFEVLTACGEMLAAVVTVVPPDARRAPYARPRRRRGLRGDGGARDPGAHR